MNRHEYINEHRIEVWRFVKHQGPYVMAIVGVLITAGWLNLPARSADVEKNSVRITTNEEAIKNIGETLQNLDRRDAQQTTQLDAIGEQLDRTNDSLDLITRHLLRERRGSLDPMPFP